MVSERKIFKKQYKLINFFSSEEKTYLPGDSIFTWVQSMTPTTFGNDAMS